MKIDQILLIYSYCENKICHLTFTIIDTVDCMDNFALNKLIIFTFQIYFLFTIFLLHYYEEIGVMESVRCGSGIDGKLRINKEYRYQQSILDIENIPNC